MKIENTRLKRELASWEEIKDSNDDLTQLQIENGRVKSELKRLKNTANDEVILSNYDNKKLKSGKNRETKI